MKSFFRQVVFSNEDTVYEKPTQFLYNLFGKEFATVIPEKDFWFAGGCIRDLLDKRLFKDIDIYFTSMEKLLKLEQYISSNNGEVNYVNENTYNITYNGWILDLVKKEFSSIEECLKTFDFTCNTIAVCGNECFVIHDPYRSISTKKLYFNSAESITKQGLGRMIRRIAKFISKGYRLNTYIINELVEAFQMDETNFIENDYDF